MRAVTISMVAFVLAAVAPVQALAQEPAPGRYSMEKTDAGIIRLDTQTGEVSVCKETAGQVSCLMAADERAAYELELDLLTKRVESLEKAMESGALASRPALPSNDEIDQVLGIMERMMQKFYGIVKNLEGKDAKPPEETETLPQKT